MGSFPTLANAGAAKCSFGPSVTLGRRRPRRLARDSGRYLGEEPRPGPLGHLRAKHESPCRLTSLVNGYPDTRDHAGYFKPSFLRYQRAIRLSVWLSTRRNAPPGREPKLGSCPADIDIQLRHHLFHGLKRPSCRLAETLSDSAP